MSTNLKPVTNESVASKVIDASKIALVLVDFWAEGSGGSKLMVPILEDLASASKDKLTVTAFKIDYDQEVPIKYGVRLVPTFMLFKDGAPVSTKVGTMALQQMREWIGAHF
jgi:thioredoxin 1